MKKFLLIFCINLTIANAQSTSYSVYDDDPSPAKFIMNLDIFQLDVGLDVASANFGIWGSYQVNKLIGVDYLVEKSYYTSHRKGNKEAPWNFDFEAGASFNLLSFNREKKIKLQVDYKDNGSSSTTTTVKVLGTKLNQFDARGGFIFKRNPIKVSGDTLIAGQNRGGLYAGINFSSFKNVAAKVDGYGKRRESGTLAIYADLIFMPMHSISSLNTPPVGDYGALGYRVGFSIFESESASDGGGATITQNFQIGKRPYSGFFLTYGIGVSIAIKN
ncbi:MAG: hypothetical protein ACI8ZM_003177 [Crocinitomix sp.]|jgi:hypothetical protein